MKKISLFLMFLGIAISLYAQKTVQGIPYSNEKNPAWSASIVPMSGEASTSFTLDNIQNWSGEGENQAALVIQWNVDGETSARVYGYRWDGDAYGVDMVKTICANNPDLYCLIQYTGSMGYTVCGLGFDADGDGEIGLIGPNGSYTSEDGIFIHPNGAENGGSPSYDYDNWSASDSDDYWASGWYNGYWSYWVSETTPSDFSYSGLGASSRKLTNGCWDGWSFMPGMSSRDWKEFVAAPSQTPAGATTQFYINGIYYTLNNYANSTVVVSAPFETEASQIVAYSGDIEIPSTFTYNDTTYTVVGIGDTAFVNAQISKITLPETAVSVGKEAFKNSTLSLINITDNITKLGEYSFYGCSNLTGSAAIPSSVTSIPAGLYGKSGITTLVLSNSVTNIGDYAFENCLALDSLELGESLSGIGISAFNGCSKLKVIDLPTTIETISSQAFANCTGLTSVITSQTDPIEITEDVFSAETYTNATLTVPMGYISAYSSATGWSLFTNMTEKVIPVNEGDYFEMNNVAYIITAYSDSINTVSVTYYKNEEGTNSAIATANKIGYVNDIIIPKNITYQNVNFEVSGIEKSAFRGATALTSIKFENSFDTIPEYALYGCSALLSVTFPKDMTTIGDWSIYGCSALTAISIPDSVTTIGSRAFYNCSKLTNIILPDSLSSLGSYAFNGCSSITSITIPSKIKVLNDYLFSGCTKLSQVTFAPDITTIGSRAFYNCSAITKFTIPNTVTSIGAYAFSGTAITEISIPSSITSIPNYLFSNCKQLKDVEMGTVKTIGNYAFQNCTAITELKIPNTVTSVGTYAFSGCTSMSSFVSPESLTTIGNYAFKGCTKLSNVSIGENVTSLGNYVFQNCTALNILEIPANVTKIGSNLVSGCNSNIAIYICNPEPISWSYKFNTTNSSTIAPINVVYGAKSAYESANGWKNSTVNEIVPEFNFDIENKSVIISPDSVLLNAPLNMIYAENIPAGFIAANNTSVASYLTVTVEYKKADEIETLSTDGTTVNSVNAITADDGTFRADIVDGLEGNTRYEYYWVATLDGIEVGRSSVDYFTTSNTTGINNIEVDIDNNAEFYDLSGVKMNRDNLKPGIYIKKQNNKTYKVLISK